jgi:NAD(P)-dependent dehydrogenase (short-subunit alcohol dehydrogenase family)
MEYLASCFGLQGQTAVITGGGGGLGSAFSLALARAGAKVAIIGLRAYTAKYTAATIQAEGGQAIGLACDVTDRAALEKTYQEIIQTFGPVDILVNGAGGNLPRATTSQTQSFFDMESQIVDTVYHLNFTGTFHCCQIFGQSMVERGKGCIINVSSMAALRPLTNVVAYSAAKAAVTNFTGWLAVHMAKEYNPHIRVNALAPGFFLTEQNRFLLTNEQDGSFTPRGKAIINQTPAGRLGVPEDLVGALLWLASPAASFITGTVIPVDGGFSVSSGV